MIESMGHAHHTEEHAPITDEVARVLVARHREFLSFLERRVESRAVAEEILQSAFVKSIEKGAQLKDNESAVAWFYRLLRNAVIDHYRRRDVQARALEREERELTLFDAARDEIEREICACMGALIPTLKDEYADMLRAVDLEGRPVADVAHALGISANNASVRLYRARQALKKQLERSCSTCAEHGCLDCSCDAHPPVESGHQPR